MIFIPYNESIYIPLILKQVNENFSLEYTNKEEQILQTISYKNNLFLDFDTLSKKHKELLQKCQLLIVANIKNIIPKKVNIEFNPFGLSEDESYFLL